MKATDTDIEPLPKEHEQLNDHITNRDDSNNKDNEPLLAIFFILLILSPIFSVPLVIDLVLFLITQIKISAILKKKTQFLSTEVIKYLKNKCRNKETLKKNIKEKFQADTYVMHNLQNFLTSNQQITVKNNNNGDTVWKLNNSTPYL